MCGFVTLDYCALYKYSYLLTYLLNALDALVSCNKYVLSRRLKQSVLLVGSKKKIREFHRASNCMRKPDGRKTRHIVTIVAWSVCLSVCALVMSLIPAKTVAPIKNTVWNVDPWSPRNQRRWNGGGNGGARPRNVETTGARVFSPRQYFPTFLHAVP